MKVQLFQINQASEGGKGRLNGTQQALVRELTGEQDNDLAKAQLVGMNVIFVGINLGKFQLLEMKKP